MNTTQAIDRLRQVIRRQHKALSTEDTYVFWLRRYIAALPGMPKDLTSEKRIEKYLTDLALQRDVSASTQNQAFNAILFFYREVLAQPIGNVNALRAKRPPPFQISNLKFQIQMIARMLYGCGLRVIEPLNLRIKDLNVQARWLCIRGAKGGNDRFVSLPFSLKTPHPVLPNQFAIRPMSSRSLVGNHRDG